MYKSFSSPVCVYTGSRSQKMWVYIDMSNLKKNINTHTHTTYAKRLHMHIKDSVAHVRVWWIMETLKQPYMH